MTIDLHETVYAYLRDYASANGYAPTVLEARSALGLSDYAYHNALRWLTEHAFLRTARGRWRGVRLNGRHCACGAEITPQNAVFFTAHTGQIYQRPGCRDCYRAACREASRAFRAANPGYDQRWQRRKRAQQAAASLTKGVST